MIEEEHMLQMSESVTTPNKQRGNDQDGTQVDMAEQL
ncbi:hypothetical protein EGR_05541 [Echinococcus granulosus]|uniref:Uncharacterized protein n=1 Tax=Echinococcus granulosus TaxID=6210 RepID=W6UN75_ECHGR|nr:hypothetical protein EGR_05541 [Echinococcus granulosus]EUB59642.1 hypothetical protein EGR_05541 [Echinococcus granulosus]